MIALSACNNKSGKSMKLEDYSIEVDTVYTNQSDTPKIASDTTNKNIEGIDLPPYSTATLVNWKEYFRKNNKYEDWNPKNPQVVLIKAIVEKDGTLTDVAIVKECDEDKLNKEALRLIRDAKANGAQIEPARNSNGEYIRSRWAIPVSFPPK